jgi:hypothetical protein
MVRRATGLGLAGGLALLAGVAMAGPEKVSFPKGYEQDFVHYASIDRESNPGQVVELFANDVAAEGLKEGGELPIGSVLVMELYKAKLGPDEKPVLDTDGRRIKDAIAVIAVMQKCEGCGQEYDPEIRNGNWEYAFFNPQTAALVDREYQSCFGCHKPLADQDFVFSIDLLRAAVADQ